MYTKRKYSVKDLARWTRIETFEFTIVTSVVVVLYSILGFEWLRIPWTPIALVGTAVAFLIGFQNNSAKPEQELSLVWKSGRHRYQLLMRVIFQSVAQAIGYYNHRNRVESRSSSPQ